MHDTEFGAEFVVRTFSAEWWCRFSVLILRHLVDSYGDSLKDFILSFAAERERERAGAKVLLNQGIPLEIPYFKRIPLNSVWKMPVAM